MQFENVIGLKSASGSSSLWRPDTAEGASTINSAELLEDALALTWTSPLKRTEEIPWDDFERLTCHVEAEFCNLLMLTLIESPGATVPRFTGGLGSASNHA